MNSFETIEKHPNPIFYREKYMLLDGDWQFDFDHMAKGDSEGWHTESALNKTIRVPFVYQSELSGIGSKELCQTVWYKKEFALPEPMKNQRILLRFGAVDYFCVVWVNGQRVGEHTGGYSSFEMDITGCLQQDGVNQITVKVTDNDYDIRQVRGKQLWGDEAFGCWYTRYTGIWQSVWLEAIGDTYINDFLMVPDRQNKNLTVEVFRSEGKNDDMRLSVDVWFEGKLINSAVAKFTGDKITYTLSIQDNSLFPFDGVGLWTPELPLLYNVTLKLIDGSGRVFDEVDSYFGVRSVSVDSDTVFLNHVPVYQRLILNQGYYPKGFITPDSEEMIRSDIEKIKSFGYNGMRIHQKIESSKYLYWCDRLGILVWEEFPSSYEFCEQRGRQQLGEMHDMVMRDRNHPAIITWVLFNESWGIMNVKQDTAQQQFTMAAYHMVKSIDNTRLVISNDGWEHTLSDICTFHDYAPNGEALEKRHSNWNLEQGNKQFYVNEFKKIFAEGFAYSGQPLIFSEYGGISFLKDDGWGYSGKVSDEEEYLVRFKSLLDFIKSKPYIKGYCYTQFTDVEHEKNGLLTIDRQEKISSEKIRDINIE